jgi:hypothetical protein
MKAPREIELKLEIPAEGLRKLERSELLRGNHLPPKGAELVSVYFDTRRLKLRKKGVSLRVRHMDGRHLQTVKRNEPGNGAALSRNEWETEIDGKNLDFEAASGTALEPLLTGKVRPPGSRKGVKITWLPLRSILLPSVISITSEALTVGSLITTSWLVSFVEARVE